ncbi:hypothetical protein GCM10011396_08840 [Undibacterium terreum]|uniref:Uncharacterized protein n=2 Tax=Undibacterium terreum TaxID=1224302 RepID=A0A916U8F1_9BURK|nr:hypothetical protein GCM10011396_08840 [Undibacterium terreum]
MGLGLLPLEKVPIFVWSLLLILFGGFLFVNEDRLTWGQGRALLLLVVGILALVYDLRKRLAVKPVEDGAKDDAKSTDD